MWMSVLDSQFYPLCSLVFLDAANCGLFSRSYQFASTSTPESNHRTHLQNYLKPSSRTVSDVVCRDIKLPVAALLKQFKENADVPLIRHFDILYIQQGISRLPVADRLELLPILIHGIATDYLKSPQHASQLFHLILRLLTHFKLPLRGSKEDDELRLSLGLEDEDAAFLSLWFGKLLLFNLVRQNTPEAAPKCPGLSVEEYKFLTLQGKPDAWDPSSSAGLNLTESKALVTRFLASGMFTDDEKFLPALFASADTNSRISDVGDDILKRATLAKDLEDPKLIEALLQLYFGS
jgi:proteasome component ECM29